MITVYTVYIARPMGPDIPVPPLHITGEVPMPPTSSLQEARAVYERDAAVLVDALHESLPGGTWDRLVAKMVEKHASLLALRR